MKLSYLVINISLVVFVLNAILILSTSRLGSDWQWVEHTRDVQVAMVSSSIALVDCESNQRAYLISGDELFLATYDRAKASLGRRLATLRHLTMDNRAQQARLGELADLIDKKLTFMDRIIAVRRRKGTIGPDDVELAYGHRLVMEIWAVLGEMDKDERALLHDRKVKLERTTHRIYAGLSVILGKDFVYLGILATVAIRSYIKAREIDAARAAGGDVRDPPPGASYYT